MVDFLIVGGGVVGLSIAWELSKRGPQVCVVDRQAPGKATSWVGAGIFPPPQFGAKHDALEQLRTASHQLHIEWSQQLKSETGIDNELRRCGGIYFARKVGEAAALRVSMQQVSEDDVKVVELSRQQLVELEPALQSITDDALAIYLLPDEMQLRSPCHLKALIAACGKNGVDIRSDFCVDRILVSDKAISCVDPEGESIQAGHCCLCAGPWSAKLLEQFEVALPIEPWRGQLILWETPVSLIQHVVNEGFRYLVPRKDGCLIAGATVEDVGFDCQNTDEAINELTEYSRELLPELRGYKVQQSWAGLRPMTPDGNPFLCRIPGYENVSIAAGHYRSGLHLSPATAVFMTQLLLDDKTYIDPLPFRLNR